MSFQILKIVLLSVLYFLCCNGQKESVYNQYEADNPSLNDGEDEIVGWPLFGKNFLNFGKLGGYKYVSNFHAGGLLNPLGLNGFHSSILGASNPNANDDGPTAQIENENYEFYGITNQNPNVGAPQMYINLNDESPAYVELQENVNIPLMNEDGNISRHFLNF